MVGNKIIAAIRSDGKVYPLDAEGDADVSCHNILTANQAQFANLVNMKLRANSGNMGEPSDIIMSNNRIQASVMDLGKKLLQYARDNDICGVETMMRKGAPIASDWLGMTAIHFAAMNDRYDICKLLVSSGVNRDARTKVDRTPLHLAAYYGHERIAQLLIENQCALNPRDMLRMTPLHWAVEKRHKAIVRLLLKYNADVTAVSKFGKTPIALAVLTEQADLLQELEAARQIQQSKKYSEQHEKETNEAVNSIMGQAKEDDEPLAKKAKLATDHANTSKDELRQSVEDLENIQDMKTLDSSAVNLLKSHGISIMKDDEDPSNNLLTTALQNGRQLILSEGGKLLLNETRRLGLNKISDVVKTPPNLQSAALVKIDPEPTQAQPTNRLRPNIVAKPKDGTAKQLTTMNVMANNNNNEKQYKNIRIISLNDFKKLYGNGNIKPQKIDSSPNKSHPSERNIIVQRKSTEPPKPVIATPDHEQSAEDDEDNDLPPNIVKVSPESDQEDSSDMEKPQTAYMNTNAQQRLFPMRYSRPTINSRPTPTRPSAVAHNADVKHDRTPVIPLLTMPEICRQLLELRKQNDELRRKYEIVQKEKEEIRNRLERLEALLLVEQTDEEYSQI